MNVYLLKLTYNRCNLVIKKVAYSTETKHHCIKCGIRSKTEHHTKNELPESEEQETRFSSKPAKNIMV